MKLVTRILLLFVTLIILLSILRTWSAIHLIEQTGLDQTEQHLVSNLNLITFAVNRELDHLENHFAVAIDDQAFLRTISAGQSQAAERMLQTLLRHSEADAAFVGDGDGNIVVSAYAGRPVVPNQKPLTLPRRKKGLTTVTMKGIILPAVFVTIPLPVSGTDKPLALTGVSTLTPSSPFSKSIEKLLAAHPLDPFIIAIFHDRKQLFALRNGNAPPLNEDLTADEADAVYRKNQSHIGKKILDGTPHLALYQPLKTDDHSYRWACAIAINENRIHGPRDRLLFTFILISVLGTGAAIALSYLVTRGINPSLNRIVKTCGQIQGGDLKSMIDTSGIHIKEFTIIASAVNTMVASISEREDTIAHNLDRIKTINGTLKENTRLARLERQKLVVILETIQDGVITVDSRGVVTYFNRAAELILAVDRHSVIGRHYEHFLPDLPLEKSPHGHLREFQTESPEGHTPLIITISPLRAESEESGYVMLMRDISRERKLDEFKADFISSLAHDIKSLLVPMKAFISRILHEKYGSIQGTLRSHIVIVNDTASKIFDIVENYLNISRIESGKLDLSPEPTDLTLLIADMVNLYHPRLLFDGPPDAFPPVQIDKTYIDRVFVNLITNAMKFSPDTSPVTIHIAVRGKMAIVSVHDRGPGIPVDEIPYIFERYRKGSFVKKGTGTGLGLFIVKSIVKAHGGDVWIEDSSEKGTVFAFSLPLSTPETQES